MKFPVRVKHRKQEAVIYGKTAAYPFYRLACRVAGKRTVKSFTTYSEARKAADAKVRELAEGNQTAALTSGEAADALVIRQSLDQYRRDTGCKVTALEAVSRYLGAVRKLAGHSLGDAVEGYLRTVVTIKRKDLAEAVSDFIALRAPKTQAKDGERADLSLIYHRSVERVLERFADTFPGHAVVDLTKDHFDAYMTSQGKLSGKSRNDHRAALKMFFRWCVRHDYLPVSHRLFEADGMTRDKAEPQTGDFYHPDELRVLLEKSEGEMRAVIALQGLAGIRLQEILRLDWKDVFKIPGDVEISAAKSKTRSRRLVEIGSALAQWLAPFRDHKGKVWTQTPSTQGCINALARFRESLDIPSRRNGLRIAFVTYHFALHQNENLTAAQAGNSPAMIHAHYKGLATRKEAKKWFAVKPARAANVISLNAQKEASR